MSPLITSVRNFKSLGEAIRSGNACIAISHLTGGDACVPDAYFGSLVVEGDGAEFRLRSHSDKAARIHFRDFPRTGKSMPKFDELKCILDGHLEVVVRGTISSPQKICSESGAFHRYTFNEIAMSGSGNRDYEATNILITSKIARSTLQFTNLILTIKARCSLEGEFQDSWRQNGLGGEITPYRYKVRQEGDDLSLEVTLQDGEKSFSAEADLKFLGALILTFVWINGGHPYTYVKTHERGDQLVDTVVQPLKRTPRCKPRLISPASHGTDAAAVLDCGIRFFQSGSPLAMDLRMLLWEYRQATVDDSITLGMLLQACSILEGLVGLVLRYPMGLSKSKIGKLRAPGQPASDTRQGHAEARFHQAGVHLEFDWDLQLQPVFQTWRKVRNALAHGDIQEFAVSSNCPVPDSYRQVIQAFNAIALRLIGYKEPVRMDDRWYAISD